MCCMVRFSVVKLHDWRFRLKTFLNYNFRNEIYALINNKFLFLFFIIMISISYPFYFQVLISHTRSYRR